jgi:predicted nucleotide-binding protein (sugar kinase/HSP70/actin superfamily)
VTEDENDFACEQGWKALEQFEVDLQEKGRAILETVEEENRVAILLLGRPYHSDPGLNHGIPEEFQVLGYPVLSVRSIPRDREYLDKYYREELDKGTIKSPLEISYVWPENYSVNSAQKVWAATFAAHHPNVVVLDLSSFKCGHDAPTFGLIDSIVNASKTPYAALHDIDANKPSGSIKIRVKTYAHALKLHEERLEDAAKKKQQLEEALGRKKLELLELRASQLAARQVHDVAIETQLAELRLRVATWETARQTAIDAAPAVTEKAELPAGMIRLGRRTEQGVVRIDA